MLRNLLSSPRAITQSSHFQSLNFPEENDETMSKSDADTLVRSDSVSEVSGVESQPFPAPTRTPPSGSAAFLHFSDSVSDSSSSSSSMQSSYGAYQPRLGLPAGFSAQTPFPSQAQSSFSTLHPHKDQWLPSSSFSGGFSSNGRPSCLVSGDYCSYQSKSCCSHSLPDGHSSDPASLEQPRSLHSIPMDLAQHSYYLPPCSSHGAPCCGPGPGHAFWMNPRPHPDIRYHMPYSSSFSHQSPVTDPELHPSRNESFPPQPKSAPSTAPLSLEQRKVFVTYEADNEKHVKEVINFVALLRHNGFYTHIDMFEQQFRSISKIDFMERYITEKDYLIIIIISPKYFEIVTNASLCVENDETLNTVYIHKQLQIEFIQNGCRNFRFIPVLFPGAKRCHVPAWLQNTHIFSWPRDRDDILRRLMRVEKYNPPPIGELPTIVSIPI
ncbi:hypothetical protein KOW79_009559 [Hemibagrus wyckioides]|uniref:E3 ubiquitin ligase TRAF3IP2 n=2 Tax=Hemibagrus wyckioides TaxID=337641 RepID=A0A9D3NRU6_9TELE|nr:E3 ubiquitin ligase TRAF3IP2 isoform X1 [Hemibagrus wyckioides]XP_058259411.1 E3 ubiquitin ligase TRAF3IP2 isoform X1 [Hemibagrus wyckioides]KAG7326158.1 hypothetical protein KOW79_009559 [Hemibagrus wyckioides]